MQKAKHWKHGIILMILVAALFGLEWPGQVAYTKGTPLLKIERSITLDQLPQGISSTVKWSGTPLRVGAILLTVNSDSFSIFINRQVRALDLDTGEWAWQRVLDGFVSSALALPAENSFLLATGAGSIYMLEASTGNINWKYSLSTGQLQTHPKEQNKDQFQALSELAGVSPSLAIADLGHNGHQQVLYLNKGKIGFLDPVTGRALAQPYALPAHNANLITVVNQNLIVVGLGDFLYAYTGKPGSLQLAWRFRKLGRTSMVGDISAYDLNGDGKQDILVGGTGALYALDLSGRLIGQFPTPDTTEVIRGAQLRPGQRVIVALTIPRGDHQAGLLVLDPKVRLLWKFSNPHVVRFTFIIFPAESPYFCESPPLIADLNQDGSSDILLSCGGRLYMLDADGHLMQTLDLTPHDDNMNNLFAEAFAAPVLDHDKIWVITSGISGEVKSKTQRGDFFVKDELFEVGF